MSKSSILKYLKPKFCNAKFGFNPDPVKSFGFHGSQILQSKIWVNNRGSFLVEILLAVSILAVGLTIIIYSFVSGLRAVVYTKYYSLAMILMENKMSELMQEGSIPASLSEEKTFEPPYERFSYELKTESGPEAAIFNKVFLRCFWQSGKKTSSISLATYFYNLPE